MKLALHAKPQLMRRLGGFLFPFCSINFIKPYVVYQGSEHNHHQEKKQFQKAWKKIEAKVEFDELFWSIQAIKLCE